MISNSAHDFEHSIFFTTQILSHLTDIIYFGALPPCSVCKNGKFVFDNSGYRCTGYDSVWSKCVNTVKSPARVAVEIPAEYRGRLGVNGSAHARILRCVGEISDEDIK